MKGALLPMAVLLGIGSVGVLTMIFEYEPRPSDWYDQIDPGLISKHFVTRRPGSGRSAWFTEDFDAEGCLVWRGENLSDVEVRYRYRTSPEHGLSSSASTLLSKDAVQNGWIHIPPGGMRIRMHSKKRQYLELEIKHAQPDSVLCNDNQYESSRPFYRLRHEQWLHTVGNGEWGVERKRKDDPTDDYYWPCWVYEAPEGITIEERENGKVLLISSELDEEIEFAIWHHDIISGRTCEETYVYMLAKRMIRK